MMLVSEYATEVINTRPYKYQTRQTFFKDLKRLGIWDLEVEQINSALIRDVVEQLTTQSTRKRLYITARSIFRDLGICQDLPNLEAEGKIYDIPPQEQLEWLIDRSKYRLQLLLCMFGGLRVGEACAVTPEKLSGDYLDVNQAYSQDGLHLGSPKTYGKILLPHWLAEEVKNMQPEQLWSLGRTTKLVSHSCYKLSRGEKFKSLSGGKTVNPHMLRHWYATDMIRRGVNPEVVRRQMRHKNVSVTLKIYTQVRSEEIEASLPNRVANTTQVVSNWSDNVISIQRNQNNG
ncbi:MAG: tyrosine-type recombinase/integrase [Actinobacteria bacterium]|nr:tyrosine-type recombinase/integrase [Actinomycetota bacterium]MTA60663.1 tyrosine-type recombinase/integrase [Actinomycetota bacterium]MTB20009.1 tyrosine-type recombinase/integrase [Actinomycetota bacterium]